ncbi:MAG: VWA domain-containing protein [Bryobacterales bacterium]
MRVIRRASIVGAVLGCLLALAGASAPTELEQRVEEALRSTQRLRVYDWVEYKIDGSTVTLSGTVSLVSLAPDLERRVRQVEGVTDVLNHIEPPAPSSEDMAMRVNAYWRIYGNPELRRYSKGSEHIASRIQREDGAPKPILLRPIHAVVQDGRIILHGEVDQERDVETAERAAWDVMGVKSVDNQLAVVTDNTEERQALRPGPDPWWTDVTAAHTPSLLVDNPSGGVKVRVVNTDAVRIRKSSEDRAVVDGDVVIDRLQRRMRVRARPADGARVDLDIDLPYGYMLEVESVDGWVDLRGLFRRANVKIATGQVDVTAPWQATRLRVESVRKPPIVELPNGVGSSLDGLAPDPDMVWTLEDGRPARESVYGDIHIEAQWPDALRIHEGDMPGDSPVRMHAEAAETIRRMFRLDKALEMQRRGPQSGPDDGVDLDTGFAHFSDDVRLVDLDVAVLNEDGRPIPGLTAADFEILEEGVPQTVKTVEGENTGFNLVLLLDCSTSTLDDRFTLIQAARQFVNIARPQDRVAVYVLADSYLQVLSPLTDNEGELLQRIDDIPPLAGSTPLYDAIVLSYAQELARRRFERNALVVLSDGMDNQLLPRLGHSRPSMVAFEDLERAAAEMNSLIYPVYWDAAEAPLHFAQSTVASLAEKGAHEHGGAWPQPPAASSSALCHCAR